MSRVNIKLIMKYHYDCSIILLRGDTNGKRAIHISRANKTSS